MARFHETSLHIRAASQQVWAVLTDVENWPRWDSGVTRVDGKLAVGQRLTITVAANPKRPFPVKVTELAAPHQMTFSAGIPLAVFTGTRSFTITPMGASECQLTLREEYSGMLAKRIYAKAPGINPAFMKFVQGLARQSEQR